MSAGGRREDHVGRALSAILESDVDHLTKSEMMLDLAAVLRADGRQGLHGLLARERELHGLMHGADCDCEITNMYAEAETNLHAADRIEAETRERRLEDVAARRRAEIRLVR